MYSDTTWSIPCCAAVSVSISVEGHLLAVGAPLCEQGDDGSKGGAEESGAACVKRGSHSKSVISRQQAIHTQTHKPSQYKQVNTNMALLTLLQWRTQYNRLMTEHST